MVLSLVLVGRRYWRPTIILASGCSALFAFYVLNLYANIVPVIMPGMLENDRQATMNVRYGKHPGFRPLRCLLPCLSFSFIRKVDQHRAYSLFLLAHFFCRIRFLPQAMNRSISNSLVTSSITEAIHNQGFWMPPFVEVSQKLKADMEALHDQNSLVMTNTRIVHVAVWATGHSHAPLHARNDENTGGRTSTVSIPKSDGSSPRKAISSGTPREISFSATSLKSRAPKRRQLRLFTCTAVRSKNKKNSRRLREFTRMGA